MSVPLNNTICSGIVGGFIDLESNFKQLMIGVILSAMAYGAVLSLTLSYVALLLKTSYDISRRRRIFLLVYVTFMFANSTVYIIIIITAFRTSLSKLSSGSLNNDCSPLLDFLDEMNYFENGQTGGFCITLANWGTDGFMLWRCVILYEGVSPPRRIALNTILGLMALISLGSGLAFMIDAYGLFNHFQNGAFLLQNGVLFLVQTGTTIIFNLITATLITFRILYFDRYIRKTVGFKERKNPYKTVIILCIESSALIVVFGAIYFVLAFQTSGYRYLTLLQLLVHVYVISPLLIIYRVARGRTVTISQRPSENRPTVLSLHFAPPPPPPSSNNLSSSNNEN